MYVNSISNFAFLQLDFATVNVVNSTIASEKLSIDWNANDLDEIEDYIEKHRIIVWDHAYYFLFRKQGGYSRIHPFLSQDGAHMAMQQLLYRYYALQLSTSFFYFFLKPIVPIFDFLYYLDSSTTKCV